MRQFGIPSRTTIETRSILPRRRRPTHWPVVEGLEERLRPSGYLLVVSFANDSVLRYNESTGTFMDAFVPRQSGGLREPMGVVYGPGHNVYVASGLEPNQGTGHKDVLRY